MMKHHNRKAMVFCLLGALALLTGCSKESADSGTQAPDMHPQPGAGGMNFCDFKAGPEDAVVKIRAFYPGRHEDTLAAVKGLLKDFPKTVSVEIVDWRRPEGLAARDAAGLVCAGVTINGKNAFELTMNGKTSKVLFVRGIGGEWTKEDLYAAVKKELEAAK